MCECVWVCVVYRRAGRARGVHGRVNNMPVFCVSQHCCARATARLCDMCVCSMVGGVWIETGHKKPNKMPKWGSDIVNEEWERWVKLVKDSGRKERKRREKEQRCLRFKATSQLARGHSTCGELPKHLTTRQPPLSSTQPTPTHRHYQTTTHHLFIEAIYIRFQYWFNVQPAQMSLFVCS